MLFKKKYFFLIILFFSINNFAFSYENKILFNVNGNIITSLDISNEIKYISIINSKFLDLQQKEIFEIAKNSLIKEKIKKIEVYKKFKRTDLNKVYLNNIIKDMYLKKGFKSLNQFELYLIDQGLDIKTIEEKFIIDLLWNELIFHKFSTKIRIDEEELKQKIKNEIREKENFKSFKLSEIIFEVKTSSEFPKKFKEIKESIKENGFENTALTYSISDSASVSGDLGWINENLINKKIYNEIKNLKINEISNPITVPNGFLILRVDEIKKIKKKIDFRNELKKIIRNTKNQQLNQFSNLYFNKIKKDVYINEFK